MKLLVLTPLPSPFVEAPLREALRILGNAEMRAVFTGNMAHRSSWGKTTWPGDQLSGSRLARISQLSKIVSNYRPDHVLLPPWTTPEGWWLRRWALRSGVPFFVGPMEPQRPASLPWRAVKQRIQARYFHGASGLAVMGRNGHRQYASVFDGPIADVPYSFDLSGMLAFPERPLDPRPLRFLYSGRMTGFRGPLDTVRAFAEVHRDAPQHAQLVLSGVGPQLKEVEKLISVLGLHDACIWRNDYNGWNDLRNLYREADVLVSIGRYNTWSLTIQEAMAAGMGIIATQTTEAASTLVIDGYNGFLIPPGKTTAAAKAMRNYLHNPMLANIHGRRSREIVETVDVKPVGTRLADLLSKS